MWGSGCGCALVILRLPPSLPPRPLWAPTTRAPTKVRHLLAQVAHDEEVGPGGADPLHKLVDLAVAAAGGDVVKVVQEVLRGGEGEGKRSMDVPHGGNEWKLHTLWIHSSIAS